MGALKTPIYLILNNMPKKAHKALNKAAKKKFGTTASKKAKAYVYGTLDKIEKKMKAKVKKK